MVTPPSVLVIAEAGVNHDGDLDAALDLVDVAADAGADAVKFQTFDATSLVGAQTPKAPYQKRMTPADETSLHMLKRLELGREEHRRVAERARQRGIQFLSTPFDQEALRFLVDELDVPLVKVSSGDLTNGPLLLAAARVGKPLILSTGMADINDIRAALSVVAFASIDSGLPTAAALAAAYASPEGSAALADRVTLLHCTTEYPAPFEAVNLRAMETMRTEFRLPVGYSDHTLGLSVPIAATALGAVALEKHFTLSRTRSGPDHAASLEPDELALMVRCVRDTEAALGSSEKRPGAAEMENAVSARRSLVAARPIAAGTLLTESDIDARRPATGRSPMQHWEALGRPAARDLREGDLIEW